MISRRELLFVPALAALPLRAFPKVEITGIETFQIKVNHRGNWMLVRMHASGGLTGIGEASHGGKDAETLRHLQTYSALIKGRSIWDGEWFRSQVMPTLARDRNAVAAYSALEQCLWDLRGKATGLPVYELLGGKLRERIRNYANINRSTTDRTPAGFARMAESAMRAGFDAVKLAPWDDMPHGLQDSAEIRKHMQLGIECGAAVRKEIGGDRDLLLDVHSRFDLNHGKELTALVEPLKLFWLEEVTTSFEDLAAIRKLAKMPTAGGELLLGVQGFHPYIAAGAVDIVMPDIKYDGGVLEMRKIAALAEGAGLKVSPHGPASPVGNAIAAHICATLPNFHILEFSHGEVPWRAEIIEPPESLSAGHLAVNPRSGYGITLNDAALAKHAA